MHPSDHGAVDHRCRPGFTGRSDDAAATREHLRDDVIGAHGIGARLEIESFAPSLRIAHGQAVGLDAESGIELGLEAAVERPEEEQSRRR